MKLAFLVILFYTSFNYSQELNCRVEVNFENLPVINRELLSEFKNIIEGYMNATRFTNENFEGQKIDCALSIFFTGASSDVDYTAQVVVVSQRPVFQSPINSSMLTLNDGQWSFQYEKGRAMISNQTTFDPLTGFLDFYANVIIGFDWDSWEEFGGTRYFQKAQDIINLGATSSFSNGWQSSSSTYSRWGLVNDVLTEKYSVFRSSIFDYHYGIDIFRQNKNLGQQKIVSLIDVLYNMWETQGGITSVFVKTFFDAKYGEIIEHLKDYSDVTIFDKLKKIDPPHAARYDEILP